jgi:hypothetical protein
MHTLKAKTRRFKCRVWRFKTSSPGRLFLPPDPSGKHGKYLEHGSNILVGNFPDGSCRKALEVVGIHWEISDRNTASNFPVFSVAFRPYVVHLGPTQKRSIRSRKFSILDRVTQRFIESDYDQFIKLSIVVGVTSWKQKP